MNDLNNIFSKSNAKFGLLMTLMVGLAACSQIPVAPIQVQPVEQALPTPEPEASQLTPPAPSPRPHKYAKHVKHNSSKNYAHHNVKRKNLKRKAIAVAQVKQQPLSPTNKVLHLQAQATSEATQPLAMGRVQLTDGSSSFDLRNWIVFGGLVLIGALSLFWYRRRTKKPKRRLVFGS